MRILNLTLSVCAILFLLHNINSSPAHAQSKFIELEFEVPLNVNFIHPDIRGVTAECKVCLAGSGVCHGIFQSRTSNLTLDANRSASATKKVYVRAERALLNSKGWKSGTPLGWQCKLELSGNTGKRRSEPTQDRNAAAEIRAASDRPFNVVERGTVTIQ